MKKKKFAVILLAILLLCSSGVSASGEEIARVSNQKIKLDGAFVDVGAYNISDENYFKIRDIAAVLKNTDKKIGLEYDDATKSVIVNPGKNYEEPSNSVKNPLKDETAIKNAHQLIIRTDAEEKNADVKSYNISGNNYYRLRDLGKILHFGVEYDAQENTVLIDTKNVNLNENVKREDVRENYNITYEFANTNDQRLIDYYLPKPHIGKRGSTVIPPDYSMQYYMYAGESGGVWNFGGWEPQKIENLSKDEKFTGYWYFKTPNTNTAYSKDELVNIVKSEIAKCTTHIVVPIRNFNVDSYRKEILDAFDEDLYSMTIMNSIYCVSFYDANSRTGIFQAIPNYNVSTQAELLNFYNHVDLWVAQNISSDMSDAQKVEKIYRHVIESTDYRYDSGNFKHNEFSPLAIKDGEDAVCQAYATYFGNLANRAGLEVELIKGMAVLRRPYNGVTVNTIEEAWAYLNSGVSENHMWNRVKVDGKWYHLDATWDDPNVDGKNPYFLYYLVNDATMAKTRAWNYGKHPNTSATNYAR